MLNYKKFVFSIFWGIFLLFGINSQGLQAHTFNLTPTIQQKTFITSDKVKLHYLIGGQGENTLVFIPGWLMPAEVFNAQLN